jgi:WD40 repeat protein
MPLPPPSWCPGEVSLSIESGQWAPKGWGLSVDAARRRAAALLHSHRVYSVDLAGPTVVSDHVGQLGTALALDPAGETLVVAGYERTIRALPFAGGPPRWTTEARSAVVSHVHYSTGGRHLWVAYGDHHRDAGLDRLDAATGERLGAWTPPARLVLPALQPSVENLFVQRQRDGAVELLDIETGEVIVRLGELGHYDVQDACFHPDGQLLAWCEGHAKVHGFDLRTRRTHAFEFPSRSYLSSLDFDPSTRILAVAKQNAEVWLVDLEAGVEVGHRSCWGAGALPVIRHLGGDQVLAVGNRSCLERLTLRRGDKPGLRYDEENDRFYRDETGWTLVFEERE